MINRLIKCAVVLGITVFGLHNIDATKPQFSFGLENWQYNQRLGIKNILFVAQPGSCGQFSLQLKDGVDSVHLIAREWIKERDPRVGGYYSYEKSFSTRDLKKNEVLTIYYSDKDNRWIAVDDNNANNLNAEKVLEISNIKEPVNCKGIVTGKDAWDLR